MRTNFGNILWINFNLKKCEYIGTMLLVFGDTYVALPPTCFEYKLYFMRVKMKLQIKLLSNPNFILYRYLSNHN